METAIREEIIGIIVVLIILALGMATIPLAFYAPLNKMTASPALTERNDFVPEVSAALGQELAAFLNVIGFKFSATYSFQASKMGIWQQPDPPAPRRIFSFSRTNQVQVTEFVTQFSDEYSLTTTNTNTALVFPRPYGSFIQSFPEASIQELWDWHTRAEEYLASDVSINVKECRRSFAAGFRENVLRQAACIQAISYWPVRAFYWLLVRRFQMRNRPIWSQNLVSSYVVRIR